MAEKSKAEGALIEWWSNILRSETPENRAEFAAWMDRRWDLIESLQHPLKRRWPSLLKDRNRLN